MELKLENEILKLQPNLTVKQVHEKALDIFAYWIEACLPDVLESDK